MNTTSEFEISPAVRDLVHNLRIADQETNGHPRLSPVEAKLARQWLTRVLIDVAARIAHVRLLQTLYKATFRVAPPRRDWIDGQAPEATPAAGFRHNVRLSESMTAAICLRGLDALDDEYLEVLAMLLLNPVALCGLADEIDSTMPDYWLDAMEESGRELLAAEGISIADISIELPPGVALARERVGDRLAGCRGTASLELTGADRWKLRFDDEAAVTIQHRIAEQAFGDAVEKFELFLVRLPVATAPGMAQAVLEMTPAPARHDVTVTLTLRTFGDCAFTLEAAPHPRGKTRSEPSVALPDAAFDFTGDGEWLDTAWPPRLMLRGVDHLECGDLSPLCPAAVPLFAQAERARTKD